MIIVHTMSKHFQTLGIATGIIKLDLPLKNTFMKHRSFIVKKYKSPVIYQISHANRSEEHTSELQSRGHLVCRLLLEKKNNANYKRSFTRLQKYNHLTTV